MSRNKKILFAFILSMPVILFVLQQYLFHAPGLKPTGFTVDENVLYMSYAHQYVDADKFSLFYSNPFDGDPASPKIYFQPQILFLAGCLKLGADPGLLFSLFGILMTFLCMYTGLLILEKLIPQQKNFKLISILFSWGGGLLALGGIAASLLLKQYHTTNILDGIYAADPGRGWWILNWGRNGFLPLEAYYHFLFLLSIYFLLTEKWRAALFTGLLLSASHPFTGILYLLIVNAWAFTEKFIFRHKNIPWWFVAGNLVLAGMHVGYYLFFLNSFPEHRKIFEQYSVGWTYSLLIALPAYCIVAGLTTLEIFSNRSWKAAFQPSSQRLFFGWAIISFVLSKHEWFMKAMQPIHFTRGYTWAGLFLFSLPVLQSMLGRWQIKKRIALLYIFILLFLSDNILWVGKLLTGKNNIEWEGHISADTRQALDFLNKSSTPNDLLVGNASLVNYLSNVYTHSNAWVTHPYNTPDRDQRIGQMDHYLATGEQPAGWNGRRIIIIRKKTELIPILALLQTKKVFENGSYEIFTP